MSQAGPIRVLKIKLERRPFFSSAWGNGCLESRVGWGGVGGCCHKREGLRDATTELKDGENGIHGVMRV